MTERCHVRLSDHAKEKIFQMDISKERIAEGILKGTKRIEKDSLKGNKIISRYKEFEIVYSPYPCNWYIISVFWLIERR